MVGLISISWMQKSAEVSSVLDHEVPFIGEQVSRDTKLEKILSDTSYSILKTVLFSRARIGSASE